MGSVLVICNGVGNERSWQDYTFIAYGRTRESARKRAMKEMEKYFYSFEYDFFEGPIAILLDKHWKYCRPASIYDPSEQDEADEWKDLFEINNISLPSSGRAGIIDIDKNMYNKILGELLPS